VQALEMPMIGTGVIDAMADKRSRIELRREGESNEC
jgi:hypothetical protein